MRFSASIRHRSNGFDAPLGGGIVPRKLQSIPRFSTPNKKRLACQCAKARSWRDRKSSFDHRILTLERLNARLRLDQRKWAVLCALLVVLIAPFHFHAQTCSDEDEQVWISGINSPTEGGTLTVTVQRNDVAVDSRLNGIRVRVEYVGDTPSFSLFSTTVPTNRLVSIPANDQSTTLSLQTSDNDVVSPDIEIRARIFLSSTYCVPNSSTRPRERVGKVIDNDEYSLFVELGTGQASTISEAESIDLSFKRCVLVSDASVECTDPATNHGVDAPVQSMSIYYDTDGNYFSNLPNSVSFAKDKIEASLTISPIDDEIYESKQTGSIKVRTTNPDSGRSDQSVSVSVSDNDRIGLSVSMPERVDEGDSVTITLNRVNSEVHDAVNVAAELSYHTKMFSTARPPGVRHTFQLAKDETSSSISITSVDDDENEGDGMLRVDVSPPTGYTAVDKSAWTRIVDDDLPHLRFSVDKTEVVEGESVEWTLLRDDYHDVKTIARASYEVLHRYPPPEQNFESSGTQTDMGSSWQFGFILPETRFSFFSECEFGRSHCEDVTGPLGGYVKRRILPFPPDTFEGFPDPEDQTFYPRYTIESSDWIQVDVINSGPGVKIAADMVSANEGQPVSFTLTRFGGSTTARSVAMRINVDITQNGSYLSSDVGSRVVTFPLDSETVTFSLDTDDDDIDLADGSITATLQAGASTGEVEDTYEFRTIQKRDGSYDHTRPRLLFWTMMLRRN